MGGAESACDTPDVTACGGPQTALLPPPPEPPAGGESDTAGVTGVPGAGAAGDESDDACAGFGWRTAAAAGGSALVTDGGAHAPPFAGLDDPAAAAPAEAPSRAPLPPVLCLVLDPRPLVLANLPVDVAFVILGHLALAGQSQALPVDVRLRTSLANARAVLSFRLVCRAFAEGAPPDRPDLWRGIFCAVWAPLDSGRAPRDSGHAPVARHAPSAPAAARWGEEGAETDAHALLMRRLLEVEAHAGDTRFWFSALAESAAQVQETDFPLLAPVGDLAAAWHLGGILAWLTFLSFFPVSHDRSAWLLRAASESPHSLSAVKPAARAARGARCMHALIAWGALKPTGSSVPSPILMSARKFRALPASVSGGKALWVRLLLSIRDCEPMVAVLLRAPDRLGDATFLLDVFQTAAVDLLPAHDWPAASRPASLSLVPSRSSSARRRHWTAGPAARGVRNTGRVDASPPPPPLPLPDTAAVAGSLPARPFPAEHVSAARRTLEAWRAALFATPPGTLGMPAAEFWRSVMRACLEHLSCIASPDPAVQAVLSVLLEAGAAVEHGNQHVLLRAAGNGWPPDALRLLCAHAAAGVSAAAPFGLRDVPRALQALRDALPSEEFARIAPAAPLPV